MIINYSIIMSGHQYSFSAVPSYLAFFSAVRNNYGECCNITKLETSYSAWWSMVIDVSYLSRYNMVVF